jgi:AraC-like DNA-binding protein
MRWLLGIRYFWQKPIRADQVLQALETFPVTWPASQPFRVSDRTDPSAAVLRVIRDYNSVSSTEIKDPYTPSGSSPLPRTAMPLAQFLIAPDLTFIEFVSGVNAFRTIVVRATKGLSTAAADVCTTITHASVRTPSMLSPVVRRFLFELCRMKGDPGRSDETVVAAQLGIHRSTLWRAIMTDLNLTFSHCRRCVMVRNAALALAYRTNRVSEVAYTLGYKHVSHFDKDFYRCLGVLPRAFRTLQTAAHGDALNGGGGIG